MGEIDAMSRLEVQADSIIHRLSYFNSSYILQPRIPFYSYSLFENHGYFHGYFEIVVKKNNRVTAILSVLPIANRLTLIFYD